MSVNYNWFDDEMCDVAHEFAVANYTAADFRNIEQLKEYAHERVKDELIKWCQLWERDEEEVITDDLVDDCYSFMLSFLEEYDEEENDEPIN